MTTRQCLVRTLLLPALTGALLSLPAATGGAAAETPQQRLLADYAAQALRDDGGFSGFTAERGRALYLGRIAGSGANGEPRACATCHTANPTAPGRHFKTGRTIDPMAVSANPARFSDGAKAEKRFDRDCPAVLGRACTAREKGDFISYLLGEP